MRRRAEQSKREGERPIGETPAPRQPTDPRRQDPLWWLRHRPALLRRFVLAQVLDAPRWRRRRPWHDPRQGT